MNILLIGGNGFIGSHLIEAIVGETDWTVDAFDLADGNIARMADGVRVKSAKGDIFTDDAWLDEHVAAADVVVPLAGIAKPAYYLKKPLWTFELDFEQNLKIVRMCANHGKRLIFPSTSEVYGLSEDALLLEDWSPLVVGPVSKMRWIYSVSKQMMDRLILAFHIERGLDFTIFRPFNWLGPRLDTFADAEERKARATTQMIYDVLHRGKISLVGGGTNRRSFTWIGDAISALLAILRNEGGRASGEIFNIGNPENNASVKELAHIIVEEMSAMTAYPEAAARAKATVVEDVTPDNYYGEGYDDMKNRVPSIEKMHRLLGWKPSTDLRTAIRETAKYYAAGGR